MIVFWWLLLSCSQLEEVRQIEQESIWQGTTQTSLPYSLKLHHNGWLAVKSLQEKSISQAPVNYTLLLNGESLNTWQEPHSSLTKEKGFYLNRQGLPLDAQGTIEVILRQNEQLVGRFSSQVHAQKYLKDSSGYFVKNPKDKLLIIAYDHQNASLAANFSDRFGFHLYHRYQSSTAYLALGESVHALESKHQEQDFKGLAVKVLKLNLQQNQLSAANIFLWDSLNAQLTNFETPQNIFSSQSPPHSIKVKLLTYSHQPWFLALGKDEKLFIARQEPGKQGSIEQVAPFPLILYVIIEHHAVHSRLIKKLPTEEIILSPQANLIPQLSLEFSKPQVNKDMLFSLNSRALERPLWWFDNRLDQQRSSTVIYTPAPNTVNLAIKIRAYDAWNNTLTRYFSLPISQKNISWESSHSYYLAGNTAPTYDFHAQMLEFKEREQNLQPRFLWKLYKINELEQSLALDKNMQVIEEDTPLFTGKLNEPLKLRFIQSGRYRLHLELENDEDKKKHFNKKSYQETFWVNHPLKDLKIKGSSSFFAEQETIFIAQISNSKEQEQDGDILSYTWFINGQDPEDLGCSKRQETAILFLKCREDLVDNKFQTLQLQLGDGVYPPLSAEHRFNVKSYQRKIIIDAPLPPFFEAREYDFLANTINIPESESCSYVWQVNKEQKTLQSIKNKRLGYSFSEGGMHTLKLEVQCPSSKKMTQELVLEVNAAPKGLSVQKLENGSPNILQLQALLSNLDQQEDDSLQYFWYMKKAAAAEQLLERNTLEKGMRLQDNELFWNYNGQEQLQVEIRVEVSDHHYPPLSSEKLSIALAPVQVSQPWKLFRQIRDKEYLFDHRQQLALPLATQNIFLIEFFDPEQRVRELLLEEQTREKIKDPTNKQSTAFLQLPLKLSCSEANAAGWRRSQIFTLALAKAVQVQLSFKAEAQKSLLEPFKLKIRPAQAVHNLTVTTLYKKIPLQNNSAAVGTSLPAGSLIDIEILSSDVDATVYEYRFSSKSQDIFFTHSQKKAYLALDKQGQAKSKEALHSSYILNKKLAKGSRVPFKVSAHYHDGTELHSRQFYLKTPSWSWSSHLSANNKKLNVGRVYQLDGWQDNVFAASEKGLLELEFHESLGQLTLDRKKLWFAQKTVTALSVLDKSLFLVTKDPLTLGYLNRETRLENIQQTYSLSSLTGMITKLYAFKHSNGATLLLMLYQTNDNNPSKLFLYKVKNDFSLSLAAGVNFPQGHEALAATHYGDRIFVALHGKGVSSWQIDDNYDLRHAQHYGEKILDTRTQDILIAGNKLFLATWSGLYEAELSTKQNLQFSVVNNGYGEHLMALFSDGQSLFVQNYRQNSTTHRGIYSLLHRLQLPNLTLQESSFPDDFNVRGSMRLSMYHWQGRYIFASYEHASSAWSQKMNSCENFAQCREKPHPESEDFQALNLAWLHSLP